MSKPPPAVTLPGESQQGLLVVLIWSSAQRTLPAQRNKAPSFADGRHMEFESGSLSEEQLQVIINRSDSSDAKVVNQNLCNVRG